MTLGKYISFSLIILYSMSSYAQLSPINLKKLKLNALEVALRYESSAANSNDDQRDDFIKLFENDEIEILNDVLPDNRTDTKISVKNYIDLIPTYFNYSLKINFIPYDIRVNESNNNEGIIDVLGIKVISGREEKSQVVYSDSLDITIKMKYSSKDKSIKIVGITLNETPGKYIIIKAIQKKLFFQKPLVNDTLLINRLNYKTNENGIVLLKITDELQSIHVTSKSELLNGISNFSQKEVENSIQTNSAKNLLIAPFHISVIDLSAYWGFIPWSKSPMLYKNASNKNIYSYNAGLNLGVKIHQKSTGYWKISSGLTFFNYRYENSINNILYTYQSVDPDGYSYFRKNEIIKYVENTTISGISVPIILEKGFNYNRKWGFYVHTGLAYNHIYNNNSKSNAISQYSGLYPDFFNIEIKENGVYDFGRFELSNYQTLKTTKFFYSILLGAGNLYKFSNKINITSGISYNQNLTEIFIKDTKMLSSNSNELNTLNTIGENSQLKYFTLNIGIQYKL